MSRSDGQTLSSQSFKGSAGTSALSLQQKAALTLRPGTQIERLSDARLFAGTQRQLCSQPATGDKTMRMRSEVLMPRTTGSRRAPEGLYSNEATRGRAPMAEACSTSEPRFNTTGHSDWMMPGMTEPRFTEVRKRGSTLISTQC